MVAAVCTPGDGLICALEAAAVCTLGDGGVVLATLDPVRTIGCHRGIPGAAPPRQAARISQIMSRILLSIG